VKHLLTLIPSIVLLTGCPSATEELLLTDENNYNFVGILEVESIPTAEAADLNICWDQIVQDIQCHDTDPVSDIDNISLIRIPYLSETEVAEGLAGQGLQQADVSGYIEYQPDGNTCVSLSDMSLFGTEIDLEAEFNEQGGTFLLLLTTGIEPGVGVRVLAFLDPTAGETNTQVDIPDGCGALDVTVDLQSMPRLSVPAEQPSWPISWSDLSVDAQGFDLDLNRIDGVQVGYFGDKTPADLESEFLDLELVAEQLFQITIEAGSSSDLSEAVDANGNQFAGFNKDGLWLIALRCSRCSNPAPVFLTFVDPVVEP